MNLCIGSRVSGWCLQVTSIAAICFASTCTFGAEPFVGMIPGEERAYSALKMVFCWCPRGKFTMGSPAGKAWRERNENQVDVTFAEGYWLGKYEVTQGQWEALMSTPHWKFKRHVNEDSDCPAVYVNWVDAMSFCQRLTEKERSAGRLKRDWEYTLPTEAQWEYACRAGTRTRYSFGDDSLDLGRYAWFDDNAGAVGEEHAHEVVKKLPNGWGLYDMHGNVSEWCRDWYAEKLPGGNNPEVTTKGAGRIFRGGSWGSSARRCRSAYRDWSMAWNRFNFLGFRLALVPSRPTK